MWLPAAKVVPSFARRASPGRWIPRKQIKLLNCGYMLQLNWSSNYHEIPIPQEHSIIWYNQTVFQGENCCTTGGLRQPGVSQRKRNNMTATFLRHVIPFSMTNPMLLQTSTTVLFSPCAVNFLLKESAFRLEKQEVRYDRGRSIFYFCSSKGQHIHIQKGNMSTQLPQQ
jgi:hypothetical protein